MSENWAKPERAVLADVLDGAGPDAPTLCEGWQTRDLAAHLVVRERRPDASIGLVFKPLAGHTARVTESTAGIPYDDLVQKFRSGPGRLSPFALPGVDAAANTVEFFVHTEDVRRATPGWSPRNLEPGLDDALWSRLRSQSKLTFRNATMPLKLVRTGADGATIDEYVVRAGDDPVVVTGQAGELVLHAFGRKECRVTVTGPDDAVQAYLGESRKV